MEIKVTKLSHNCFVYEYNGTTVIADPGKTTLVEELNKYKPDYIIVTDCHRDHYNIEFLQLLSASNPQAQFIITQAVADRLVVDGFELDSYLIIDGEVEIEINDVKWQFGVAEHIKAYKELLQNPPIMWYAIAKTLFIPTDTMYKPSFTPKYQGQVVIAPFGSMERFIDYALEVKPESVFNTHDGYLNKDFTIGFYGFVKKHLEENNIKYNLLNDGDSFTITV